MRIHSPAAIAASVALLGAGTTSAEIDFNRDVRPILSNRCIACHGPDEEERKADLRLDTHEGALEALVPGDVEKSELFYRITTSDEDDLMPPPGKGRALDKDEQAIVRQWIEEGAPWATHWSYSKPTRPEVPGIPDGSTAHNPIDHFILTRLAEEGLKPSPEADRWTLARRVAVDLTGLPPTPEEARAFVEDKAPDAYERYVDGLLANPAYGERWARVWLDLARYADSAGYADDPLRTIWAYRDWVIRALNNNMTFDQFTIEQLAGDLLENPTEDQLVATAFHRNTLTNNEGGTDDEEFRTAAVVDRTNTTMAVWMGTTMACAQCHTHKYDPITQHEFFSFYDILNQSQDADKKDERPTLPIFTEEQRQQRAELEQTVARLKSELEDPSKGLDEGQRAWESDIAKEPRWVALKPVSVTSREKAAVTVAEDGRVTIPRGAATDLTTVELRTARDQEMTGIRLEVLPEQIDNFVLDQITASWAPAGAAPGIEGRFVRIALPPKSNEPLQLAEVEVLGGGTNHARTGKATQSSTYADAEAARAVDGNTDGDYNKRSVRPHRPRQGLLGGRSRSHEDHRRHPRLEPHRRRGQDLRADQGLQRAGPRREPRPRAGVQARGIPEARHHDPGRGRAGDPPQRRLRRPRAERLPRRQRPRRQTQSEDRLGHRPAAGEGPPARPHPRQADPRRRHAHASSLPAVGLRASTPSPISASLARSIPP